MPSVSTCARGSFPSRAVAAGGRVRRLVGLVALACAVACGSSSSSGERAPSEPPPEPAGDGFRVGYAEGPIDFPIGVGLAGYGGRYEGFIGFISGGAPQPPEGDRRPRPFSKLIPPSIGIHSKPLVRAIALDVTHGGTSDELVLVKADMIVPPYTVADAVVERVRARTGRDLSQQLFLSASHTHASGGRFWDNFLFSSFGGLDTYSPEMLDRIATAIADVAVRALADREPAVMGIGFRNGFDPGDRIYHDRRFVNDEGTFVTNDELSRADRNGDLVPDGRPDGRIKDRRLTVMRFDRADGSTKVVLVHFPIHGTALSQRNLFQSGDATASIELQAAEEIGAPVVHFQGSTGDIQPSEQNLEFPGMERLGRLAARDIRDVYRSITTLAAPARIRSGWTSFRQDYDLIGYPTAEPPYDQFQAQFGAIGCGYLTDLFVFLPFDAPVLGSPFQCLSRPASFGLRLEQRLIADLIFPILIDDFSVDAQTDDLFYDIAIGLNPIGGPYTEPSLLFYSRVGAFGLEGVPVTGPGGAGVRNLAFFAAPGEPTTPWGFETRHKLANELDGIDFDDTWVWGYTLDNGGYLLNKEDWVFGGSVEIQINPWGPLWGEFIRARGLEVARAVLTDQPLPEGPATPVNDPVPFIGPTPTRTGSVGVVREPVSTARFGTVHLFFQGGDVVVDTPHVVIERDPGDGTFAPVEVPGRGALDERGYETILVYEYDEDHPADPHLWSFHWQLREGDPTGRFRFRVEGINYDGRARVDTPPFWGGAPYEIVSAPFEVTASDVLALEDVSLAPDALRLAVRYPHVDEADDPSTAVVDTWRPFPERPETAVRYRLSVPAAGVTAEGTLGADGRATLPTPIAAGTYDVALEVEDAFGNTGRARFLGLEVGATP